MDDLSEYSIEGFVDGENDLGNYEGDRNEDGERHGFGTAHFPNGDVYQGEYDCGKRHGTGKYKFKNGRYDGHYTDGKRQGAGRMCYPDGSIYDGNWEDGDKYGYGMYTYPNGDIYEGQWKDDQKHGLGVYTYKSTGVVFKGTFIEGIREGPAEWTCKGFSYKGYFRNDHPFGRGKFVFDNCCEQLGFHKVTDLVVEVDQVMELVGRETRWTCTSLIQHSGNKA